MPRTAWSGHCYFKFSLLLQNQLCSYHSRNEHVSISGLIDTKRIFSAEEYQLSLTTLNMNNNYLISVTLPFLYSMYSRGTMPSIKSMST